MKEKQDTWITYFEKNEAKTFLNSKFINEDFFDDFDRYFKPKVKISKNTNDKEKKKKKKKVLFDKQLSSVYLTLYIFLISYVVLRGISLGFYVNSSILTQEKDFQGDYCGVGKHSSRPYYYFFNPIGTSSLSILCLNHCPK
jgi:Na+/melibiose symporter-like transporter